MSAELIAVLGVFVTLLIAGFAGFAWMIRRMDAMGERLEERLGARIDAVEGKLGARIDVVERDLTDVKISVARLEGTQRQFLVAR